MATFGKLALPIAASVLANGLSLGRGSERGGATFISKTYGYSMHYPDAWVLTTAQPADVLDISSFPLSKAVHGVYIPRGGAEIYVAPLESVPRSVKPTTIEEWAETDAPRNSDRPPVHTRELTHAGGTIAAIEVSGQCCDRQSSYESSLAWYFYFEGHMFKALLIYGGPKMHDEFVNVLENTVYSLKLTSHKP